MKNFTEKFVVFSEEWWSKFQQAWNEQGQRKQRLSKLGIVIFEFIDSENSSVCLNWDKNGNVSWGEVGEESVNLIPTFSAESKIWYQFVKKEIGASRAVMSGKIKYKGPTFVLFKYGIHFDLLADVAQLLL